MKACMGSLVLAVTFVALMHVRSIYSSPIEMKLLMPDVAPKTKDIYLCHKFKMDEERPVYITQFEANSSAAIAHHILLFACKDTVEEEVWNCGEMAASTEDRQFKSGPVCLSQQSIVFAWALDAPKLQLPEDVAFKLGGNTDKKYLVMQIHYADVERFKNGETDNSGLVLKGQTEPVKNLAAVYFSATGGQIKPGDTETFDAVCEIDEDVVMHPFAYRTHAHKLGIVNSGYLVRTDEVTGEQTWTEIGRRSPQLPQMFFPVSNHVEIRKGDIVASRCTMHNTRDHVVHIGSTGNDEMCNFYMMYYVKGEHLLDNNICFSSGPPFFHLNKFKSSKGVRLDMDKLPADASSVPDNQLAELEEMKKNGHGMHGAHGQSSAAKAEDDMPMKEMNMEHMDPSKSQHHRMGHQQMMPADQEDTEQSSRSLDSVELTKDDIINHLEDLERELRLRRLIQKFNLQDNN